MQLASNRPIGFEITRFIVVFTSLIGPLVITGQRLIVVGLYSYTIGIRSTNQTYILVDLIKPYTYDNCHMRMVDAMAKSDW